jgi:penicillin-binding protein 1A
MTDLLASTVNIGTGRAADIGRPVAGKTGTTSSNKDGWFLGFSSGLTTGVWMGRDDDKPVAGLFGGTAPARAFAAFMRPAVANRPVQQFQATPLPDLDFDEDNAYFGEPDNGLFVDENGNPINPNGGYPGDQPDNIPPADGSYPPGVPIQQPQVQQQQMQPRPYQQAVPQQQVPAPAAPPPQDRQVRPGDRLDQDWLDRAIGRQPRPNGRAQGQDARPNQ